jgi:hypothetical protein
MKVSKMNKMSKMNKISKTSKLREKSKKKINNNNNNNNQNDKVFSSFLKKYLEKDILNEIGSLWAWFWARDVICRNWYGPLVWRQIAIKISTVVSEEFTGQLGHAQSLALLSGFYISIHFNQISVVIVFHI